MWNEHNFEMLHLIDYLIGNEYQVVILSFNIIITVSISRLHLNRSRKIHKYIDFFLHYLTYTFFYRHITPQIQVSVRYYV